jgi:hypothetical protein
MPEISGLPSPEIPRPAPEVGPLGPEVRPEQPIPAVERPTEVSGVVPMLPVAPTAPLTEVPYEMQVQKRVENVLSEGLGTVYQGLDDATKLRVRASGEQTANVIANLLQQTTVQVRKILELIVTWLKGIPGLNQHFIEQDAKIKADKILASRPPQS